MNKNKPSLLLITTKNAQHCFIAKQLAVSSSIELKGVLVEKKNRDQQNLKKLKLKLKRLSAKKKYFKLIGLLLNLPFLYLNDKYVSHYIRKRIWPDEDVAFSISQPVYQVEELNSLQTEQLLKEMQCDYFLVIGTQILKTFIFKKARKMALNIHMGITPEYRGTKPEFWASYHHDLDKIGFTVMEIDEGVDTGRILFQHYTAVKGYESPHYLRLMGLRKIVPVVEAVIRGLEEELSCSKRSFCEESRISRQYYSPNTLQYISLYMRNIFRFMALFFKKTRN